ncbi:MAG: NAD-dependent epimerase/dehydratase family protein [Candidatus Omnitrophica bacterium]|nr:NAD-dependent epimerase/dehydratase family protein [Candidatus Omnitrophota bacterium]
MNKLAELILQDAQAVCERVDFYEIKGKTILITGASGLIGTHFLASLNHLRTKIRLPFKVYNIINSNPAEYFKDIAGFEGSEILQGDLTDINFCHRLPKADYIIHAAGYGQPGKFLQDPIRTIKLNTVVLLELFEKLAKGGKLLFLSTSEVYVGLPYPPYKETDIGTTNTNHPRACYIEAKRCGEAICNAYRQKGIEAKSARLSLAYGPGTRDGDKRVINEFIRKGLEEGISLLDQGQAKRTYCYVSDAIEIMWNILFRGSDAIYNVGGSSKITIRELAQKIGGYLKVPVTYPASVLEGLIGAPEDVFLDMSKAEHEFNKKEYVDLTQGLRKTIEWQKLLYATR